MADEYIKKDKAVNAVESLISKMPAKDNYAKGYDAALGRVLIAVRGVPTAADVQPIKHGYWEEVTDYGGWGDTHYRCSICGEEWYLEDGKPKDNNMNFCPRCGARMDGEQNDN